MTNIRINKGLIVARISLLLMISTAACAGPHGDSSISPVETSPLATSLPGIVGSPMTPEAPIPETGRASISGILYSISLSQLIPGTAFYVTPAVGDTNEPPPYLLGPRVESGDVRGVSDNMGRFVLNNVPPGEYYLAVWAPYNWILAVNSPNDLIPRLLILEADRAYELGIVYVPWP